MGEMIRRVFTFKQLFVEKIITITMDIDI